MTPWQHRSKNVTLWHCPRGAPKTQLFGNAPAALQKLKFLAVLPFPEKTFFGSSSFEKQYFLAAPKKTYFLATHPRRPKNVAFWWHFFARKASQRSPTCRRPLVGLRNAEDLSDVFSGKPPRGLQNPEAFPELFEVRKTFWRSSKCGRPSKGLRAARRTTTRFMTSRKLLKCTRHPKGSRTGLLAARKISWRS